MSSLFTKIINKEIPAEIIYEDNDVLYSDLYEHICYPNTVCNVEVT